MKKTYRYCLRTADEVGAKNHPQRNVRGLCLALGCKITNERPESIADCWFFEIDGEEWAHNDIIASVPYLDDSKYGWS